MAFANFLAAAMGAPMAGGKGPSQGGAQAQGAELDRLNAQARQSGFQNYDQMRAFILTRQNRQGEGTPPQIQGATASPAAPPGPTNAMSWHPRTLMDWVAQKINGAIN